MNRHVLLSLLFVGLALSALAEPPVPPYLTPIPDNSEWLITASSPTAAKPGPAQPANSATALPQLKTRSISVAGDLRRDVFTWSNGTTTETWFYKGVMLREYVGTMQVYLVNEGVPPLHDWEDFGWLAPGNYVGLATDGGAECQEFRTGDADAKVRALIDAKTRFPVLLEQDGVTYRFQRLPTPPGDLTLPPKFAAKWNQYTANLKSLSVNRTAR